MKDQKQLYRQMKREKKRAGNRKRRNYLKRQLRENPSEAQWSEFDFGFNSTEDLNGQYPDPKRDY